MPPLPPGVGNPFDWGREDHVSALLGHAFALDFEDGDVPLRGESGEAVWELFSNEFGPTKALADRLDPERREELHAAFVDLLERHRVEDGVSQPRPYVLILGRRRSG